ncbi:MAG: exosortase-associated EpsI family protein [Leptolyngbyaceae cyanobacterium SL_7_1]|nr:exosortase-associated EpsI family protein [Leptolyngbyaceae cyanobacterium SL_7_1]
MQLGSWTCPKREIMEQKVIDNLGVTDYLICEFRSSEGPTRPDSTSATDESQVGTEDGGETRIHPPAHCLPGSGWSIIQSEDVPLDIPGLPGAPAEVKRVVIAKGDKPLVRLAPVAQSGFRIGILAGLVPAGGPDFWRRSTPKSSRPGKALDWAACCWTPTPGPGR